MPVHYAGKHHDCARLVEGKKGRRVQPRGRPCVRYRRSDGLLAVARDSSDPPPRLSPRQSLTAIGRRILLRWSLSARDSNFRDTRLHVRQILVAVYVGVAVAAISLLNTMDMFTT